MNTPSVRPRENAIIYVQPDLCMGCHSCELACAVAHGDGHDVLSAVAAHLPPSLSAEPPTSIFYATDSIEKFQHLGSTFLGQPLPKVNLIDLGG